jgi:hypothetical protein
MLGPKRRWNAIHMPSIPSSSSDPIITASSNCKIPDIHQDSTNRASLLLLLRFALLHLDALAPEVVGIWRTTFTKAQLLGFLIE